MSATRRFVLFVMTPTILMWPLFGLHLFLLAIEGALLSLLRLDLEIGLQIYWNVGVETAKYRKTLLRQRRLLQGRRSISFREYLGACVVFPRKFSMLLRYGLPRIKK